jgi:hypothetical protein
MARKRIESFSKQGRVPMGANLFHPNWPVGHSVAVVAEGLPHTKVALAHDVPLYANRTKQIEPSVARDRASARPPSTLIIDSLGWKEKSNYRAGWRAPALKSRDLNYFTAAEWFESLQMARALALTSVQSEPYSRTTWLYLKQTWWQCDYSTIGSIILFIKREFTIGVIIN